ncbi:MAG: dimethyl sulfoxide reductase anchor subunit family protein [Pseudomonadota bacterium]
MHPALSVILFTVTSGAGFGLMILLVLMDLLGLGGGLRPETLYAAGITSLVLTTVGLMLSTGHLANPKNAWRAFFRFKTSWLSREGVFAVVYYPFAIGYLGGLWLLGGEHNGLTMVLGWIALALAIITVFSTGMIYACLKTIRQWNTALTPANYLALGVMLGALVLAGFTADGAAGVLTAQIAVAAIAVALVLKAIYYFWIGKPTGVTINTATGFTRATVRLLDVGHTAGTFLTDEFGYEVAPGRVRLLRGVVYVLGFILPAILLTMSLEGGGDAVLAWTALASAFLGIATERWLFFAEARHVVNLYHGAQRT